MCGIVGILGREPVAAPAGRCAQAPRISRLRFSRRRDAGGRRARRAGAPKASCAISKTRLESEPLGGTIGIGHTRWATHGRPTEEQRSSARHRSGGRRAQRHHREFPRAARRADQRAAANSPPKPIPRSVAHLVTQEMKSGQSPADAVAAALQQLRGAFALAFLFDGRGGSSDRRTKGLAARGRLRQRRDVSRLGRDRAGAVHGHDQLSRGWRLGRAHAQGRAGSRRAGPQSRAPGSQIHGIGASWSTRAITATSWRRRSTSSRKWSVTRSRITST